MIIGIGIDLVEVERFSEYSEQKNLSRLFNQIEIDYCLRDQNRAAERFAARFAAKEALYKALTQALGDIPCPFLSLCRASYITKSGTLPIFTVDWQGLNIEPFTILVTLSHTAKTAIAQVVLQKI